MQEHLWGRHFPLHRHLLGIVEPNVDQETCQIHQRRLIIVENGETFIFVSHDLDRSCSHFDKGQLSMVGNEIDCQVAQLGGVFNLGCLRHSCHCYCLRQSNHVKQGYQCFLAFKC